MDAVRFGRSVRALRRRRGWRQDDLAAAADVSRSAISRIELGQGDRLTLQVLARVAAALGARVALRLDWNGEAADRLLDEEHAHLVERIVRWLEERGWQTAIEVSFNVYGERGSVDVLAYHTATAVVLIVEAKTVVPDIQAMLGALDRKARLGRRIAQTRGWSATSVARLLVIKEDRTARRRIAAAGSTFRSVLPDRARRVRGFVRAPDALTGIAGLLFLTDSHQPGARQRVGRPRRPARALIQPKSMVKRP